MRLIDPDHVYKSGKFRGMTLGQRLLESCQVSDSGCWEWVESVFSNGYGSIIDKDGRRLGAHRVSAEVLGGLDTRGRVVMHTCDNKRCINPDHLVLGSSSDNSSDMVSKKRQAHGERNGGAKLSVAEVQSVRVLAEYLPMPTLARMFNLAHMTIYRIVKRKTWKYV